MYAEQCNYWKSSQSSADAWIAKAKREIESVGGEIKGEAFLAQDGRQVFMLMAVINDEAFKIEWPVLPLTPKRRDAKQTETDERAARVQAATMLYHDCKHRAVMAKVWGARTAFIQFMLLPDGQTVGSAAGHEIQHLLPKALVMLPAPKGGDHDPH